MIVRGHAEKGERGTRSTGRCQEGVEDPQNALYYPRESFFCARGATTESEVSQRVSRGDWRAGGRASRTKNFAKSSFLTTIVLLSNVVPCACASAERTALLNATANALLGEERWTCQHVEVAKKKWGAGGKKEDRGRNALFLDVPKLRCSNNSDDEERVALLVHTREDEREALRPDAVGPALPDEIADRIDKPQREPEEGRGMTEDVEAGAFLDNGKAVIPKGFDILLVEDVGTLRCHGAVQRHGEGKGRSEEGGAANSGYKRQWGVLESQKGDHEEDTHSCPSASHASQKFLVAQFRIRSSIPTSCFFASPRSLPSPFSTHRFKPSVHSSAPIG